MENIGGKKTILLVDDSRTQLSFYRIHFSKAGYEVIIAENAKEAFAKVFEYCPDVIVCDVLMRDISGFQFCKILKKNIVLKNIPVILYTASVDMMTNVFWAKKAKADYFISKSADIIELLDLISKAIESSKFTEERKEQIKNNADKAMLIFSENKITSDVEWMKQVISDEFRNLIRYTDDVSILLTKLFGMLSMILPYNVCFIAFTHLNKEKAYEVHTNINNVIPSEGIMQKLTQEFVEEAFGSGKPFVNIMYKTEIKQTEPTQNLSDYKQHICLPIKNFGRVIAALSFYWPLPHNLTNVSYYGEIEAMITQLLQNKVYNENVSFLSYKNSNIGLYNKMQFLDNLNIELARTQIFNSSISLAVLTFADYDKLSRQYGFDAVNIAIEKSIRTIIATLRFPDKVYRYDHKTLLILLVNVDKEKGMIPVNRILNILKTNKQTFVNDGVSMGAIVTVEDNSLYNGDTETFFEHILKSHKQKTEDLEGSLVNESIN